MEASLCNVERCRNDRRRRPSHHARHEHAHSRRGCAHRRALRRRGRREPHRHRAGHRPAARDVGRHAPRGARDAEGPDLLARRQSRHGRAPRAHPRPAARARRAQGRAPCLPEAVRGRREQRREHRRIRRARRGRPEPADQVRRPVGPVRFGRAAAGHREAPREVAARHHESRDPGRLRHDGDRPRLRCGRHRNDRDVRPRHRRVRHPHPVPRRVEGLPRQRRPARQGGDGVRAAHHPRRQPRRALLLRSAPRRRGPLPPRHRRRGRRSRAA